MKQEDLDNSIYWPILMALVTQGNYPDIRNYANVEDFEAAKQAIISNPNKMFVDIKNVAAGEARGEIVLNSIIIDRLGEEAGKLGAGNIYFEKDDAADKFTKLQNQETSENVEYQITVMAKSVAAERYIQGLIRQVFNTRKYVDVVDTSGVVIVGESFFIRKGDTKDLSTKDYVEKKLMYTVEDVWLSEPEVVAENISPILEIIDELVPNMPDGENN